MKHRKSVAASFLMTDLSSRLNLDESLDLTWIIGTNANKNILNIERIKNGALDFDEELISMNSVIDKNDICQKIGPGNPDHEIIENIKLALLESKLCLQIIKSKG